MAFVRGHQGLPQTAHSGLQWTHYRQNTEERTKNFERERRRKYRGRNESVDPRTRGRKEALQACEQIFPCTHGEDHSGVEIHEGSHTGAGECFLKELQPTLEQVKSEDEAAAEEN